MLKGTSADFEAWTLGVACDKCVKQRVIAIRALLVVVVVVLFLQSWQASLIPVIAIPVPQIGTMAILAIVGFSLNNLSLCGIVLAVGIVVDDAIVVVENVERNIRVGLTPKGRSSSQARRPRVSVRFRLGLYVASLRGLIGCSRASPASMRS